jgi:CheY-like chemotaxis protein
MKMLVVEDDQFYAQRIMEYLQDHSVETRIVQSAEEAVNADLITVDGAIIDLMMPNNVEASGISIEESRGGFLTGVCVARRLLAKKPGLRIVMLSSGINSEAYAWAAQKSIPFVSKEDGYHALLRSLKHLGLLPGDPSPLAFVVHGHDSAALYELKNFIQNTLKWQEPVVLREQQSAGKTLIEKFEEYAHKVDCVFVLLTPDDNVAATKTSEEKRRSRQNVVFEAGFFYGTLDRRSGRILLLHKGPLELPSDISGVVWIDITNGISGAGEEIRKEVSGLLRDQD